MSLLYIIYITASYCLILYFIFATPSESSLNSELHQEYTAYLIATSLMGDTPNEQPPQAESNAQRNTLLEAIHCLVSHTYDCHREMIQRIAKQNLLQEHILKQLPGSSTFKKCRLLGQLSSIIHDDKSATTALAKYLNSRNHDIRIHALMAMLAAKPSELITIISGLKFRLQPSDIHRIIALIRQGSLFVVIEPLFESNNHNLKMLALAIVRNFGVEIADKYLYHIIKSDHRPDIAEEAIYTLTTLKRPLKYKIIKERLALSSERQRKRLCRHLSVEGYSLNSIKAILEPTEYQYAQQLITSYKRQLAQSQTI